MNPALNLMNNFRVSYLRIVAFGVIFTVLNVLYLEVSTLHATYPPVDTLVLSFVSGLLLKPQSWTWICLQFCTKHYQ